MVDVVLSMRFWTDASGIDLTARDVSSQMQGLVLGKMNERGKVRGSSKCSRCYCSGSMRRIEVLVVKERREL